MCPISVRIKNMPTNFTLDDSASSLPAKNNLCETEHRDDAASNSWNHITASARDVALTKQTATGIKAQATAKDHSTAQQDQTKQPAIGIKTQTAENDHSTAQQDQTKQPAIGIKT